MKESSISIEKVTDFIDLATDEWNYPYDTNCYAYSLGLDIPETKIIYNAYCLGYIWASKSGISFTELEAMPYEVRLLLDLQTLGLYYEEVDPNIPDYEKFKKRFTELRWRIAFFEDFMENDFHFMRQTEDGIWYHKTGWVAMPTNLDDDEKVIRDIKRCHLEYYNYSKTYQLIRRK